MADRFLDPITTSLAFLDRHRLGNTRVASQYGVFEFEAKDNGPIASVKLGNVVTFERVEAVQ